MADKHNLDVLKELKRLQEEYNTQLSSNIDITAKMNIQEEAIANFKRIQAEQERLITESKNGNLKLSTAEKKELDEIEKSQKKINEAVKKEGFWRTVVNKTLGDYNRELKLSWRYLMDSDKIIKQTILSLGLSGSKAAEMRGSFEASAGFIANIGGNLEDVKKIMEGFADETGRARVLSARMVEDIELIGKGTGLGVEQGVKLASQFELMGINARSAMDYVQNVVDTSERMGVNTTKVLKNVSDNFKKLQTMSFQQGVKGYAQMAQYAEKMKIDMNSTFAAMDKVKTLEGAIDTFAQLQVMGGEFAKQDFLEMFYLKRNDPAKFQERINSMTKGLVSFRKMADGSFQKFISPADRDRLEAVERTLGMQTGELTTQTLRMAELQKLRGKMSTMGLSPKEKELIEGAAFFNTATNQFEATIGGQMKDITTLTKAQALAFSKETVDLKGRALLAMTAEEALKAAVLELRSALLPLLKSINDMLAWARKTFGPIIKGLSSGPGAWMKVIGAFMAAALVWRIVSVGLKMGAASLANSFKAGSYGSRFFGGKPPVVPGSTGTGSGLFEQRKGIGAGAAMAGKGKMFAGAGAGIGAAALGVGAGIGVAALGISKLADAMSKLDKTQVAALPNVIWALAGAIAAFVIPLAVLGTTATVGAAGLAALGLVAVGIGAGIGLAAVGIGLMGKGLGEMFKNVKGAGKDMLMVAGGIVGIAGALALFNFSGLGFAVFAGVMGLVIAGSVASALVANSFTKMGTAMKGTKDDWIAVEQAITSIGKANFKGGGMLADLAKILKEPLKVKFADKDVALNTYVTLDVNGTKFLQAVRASAHVVYNQKSSKEGKETLE